MSKSGATWRRFQLLVPVEQASQAAALLENATGCASATEIGRSDAAVSVYAPARGASRARAHVVTALARARRRALFERIELREESIAEDAWSSSWKRFFRPARVADRLYVVPTWRRDFEAPRGAAQLFIDPGMAFGTGQHATTRLAIKLSLDATKCGSIVLDIGCGSGIVGIAAALAGAAVHASDADSIAVAAAKMNFDANGLRPQALRRYRGVPPSFPRADVIIANITARVLAPMAQTLAAKLKPRGRLILSGYAERSRRSVEAAMAVAGLRVREQRSDGGWIAQVYSR
ncbi:MAG: 50S ribosomal protein L11 methyltransferase [Candidatus Eremiobacteraeota bacterium]|nr:50S ribosomal protein L11 methyltransferase [Candidatus Eremiobacteraeota bacterium]